MCVANEYLALFLACFLTACAAPQPSPEKSADAEREASVALDVAERRDGMDSLAAADAATRLAHALSDQGRYSEEEALLRRALGTLEKIYGPNDIKVAQRLNNLAWSLSAQGRNGEAEAAARRSVEIRERSLGSDHPDVAKSLTKLADIMEDQGRYKEAEASYRRILAIRENALGPQSPDVAATLRNLAGTLRAQGRYADAEILVRRSLAILETSVGPDDPDVALGLMSLARLLALQARYGEAEALDRRALQIREKAFGPDHPEVAASILNLANRLSRQGRYSDAAVLHRRALEIREKKLGPDHPEVADSLEGTAINLARQGAYREAAVLFERSLVIREKAQGSPSEIARGLSNLAEAVLAEGRNNEAEALYRRSLAISEKALGSDHPSVVRASIYLAVALARQGRYSEAMQIGRRSMAAQQQIRELEPGDLTGEELLVSTAWPLARQEPAQLPALSEETFVATQIGQSGATAAALAQVAARFASGDSALASSVRTREDLIRQLDALDRRLLDNYASGAGFEDQTALRDEIADTAKRLDAASANLAQHFPDYAELTTPTPLSSVEVGEYLATDEALLLYRVLNEESFVWVLRPGRLTWQQIKLGRDELKAKVEQLRATLDPGQGGGAGSRFPIMTARALRAALLPDEATLLAGVDHLYVVPDGPLESLPFSVLASGEVDRPAQTDWLARRYATTTLPSVSSLKALRRMAQDSQAREPFRGVGDPVLTGGGSNRSVAANALYGTRGLADPAVLRSLPALPETAGELRTLAARLGAGPESILIGPDATEARVKSGVLHGARTVAFATHAAVAGDLVGLAEPALVLTPPAEASEADDGLLTASEAAQLELDADLVLLSACNTAAPDGTPGAKGLSGLAKAFIYAGARSLLVSHWAVYSNAAAELTTGMIDAQTSELSIGRAEALRRSMLKLIDSGDPTKAHPSYWAPFVIVGEGGAPIPAL